MRKVMSVAVASTLFGSVGASAHVEDEWREFKAQYAALAERMNALEAENQKLREMGAGKFVTVEDLSATNEKIASLEKQREHQVEGGLPLPL
jgi:predicted nuclease with TOPRIM domain